MNQSSVNLSPSIDIQSEQAIASSEIFSFFSPVPLAVSVIILILLILIIKRKKTIGSDSIALIGQRFSGKTQLFIKINSGKVFETIPSIHNNKTNLKISDSKKYSIIDYFGDNISKQEILSPQVYPKIHTIIHVIDGTDATKLGDAALFLYRLLVNKNFQKRQCNYILFLNKNDDQNFLTKTKILKRIQDEIQHIKVSKRNSAEQNQFQQDYLKINKLRFDLSKSVVKVTVGSAKNDIKQLQAVLQEFC